MMLLNLFHKSESDAKKNSDINSLLDIGSNHNYDNNSPVNGDGVDYVSRNFARIVEELSEEKNRCSYDGSAKEDVDPVTGIPMYKIDIGLGNFDSSCNELSVSNKNDTLSNFACNGRILLIKFKRKNTKNIMPLSEVSNYIRINNNGEIVFLQKVDPETIYKIAKSLNNEFYFIVNSLDNVVPLSPVQALSIFKKKQNFKLNSRQHVENVFDAEGNVQKENDLCSKFHDWFGKNVRHPHPYAYSDMVITERVKNYSFVKKRTDGSTYVVKSQFSNELTDKNITMGNIDVLKGFAIKCKDAFLNASLKKEGRILAMPCPLYSKNHMLSLVIAFKPNGEINATIVNANGDKNAKQKYAIHLCKIFQLAFEKYAPHVGSRVNYFFHENRSQFGGTCMTHADCITRQLAKDPEFERDGHDLHPIKILEKAYIRGVATSIYQHAKKQGAFSAKNKNIVKNIKKKQISVKNNKNNVNDARKNKTSDGNSISKRQNIKNLINTDKFSRDRFKQQLHVCNKNVDNF